MWIIFFLLCPFAQKIWFWMDHIISFFKEWTSIIDIIEFSCRLSRAHQAAFLIMFSALCSTIWKIRNDKCFSTSASHQTFRTVILLIISLIHQETDKGADPLLATHWYRLDSPSSMGPQDLQIVPYQGQDMVASPETEEEEDDSAIQDFYVV